MIWRSIPGRPCSPPGTLIRRCSTLFRFNSAAISTDCSCGTSVSRSPWIRSVGGYSGVTFFTGINGANFSKFLIHISQDRRTLLLGNEAVVDGYNGITFVESGLFESSVDCFSLPYVQRTAGDRDQYRALRPLATGVDVRLDLQVADLF